jgi:VanZ family protein
VPYLLSVLLMAAYTVLLIRFGQFPAERLHLLEYGMMAVLVHRALTADRDSRLADHGLALGLTILIGFGDETIQWILPQRFFELKDVGLNAVSGILGLALARLVAGERM